MILATQTIGNWNNHFLICRFRYISHALHVFDIILYFSTLVNDIFVLDQFYVWFTNNVYTMGFYYILYMYFRVLLNIPRPGKMAEIFQTRLSYTLSWITIYEIIPKFDSTVSLSVTCFITTILWGIASVQSSKYWLRPMMQYGVTRWDCSIESCVCKSKLNQANVGFQAYVSNYILIKLWPVVTHQWPNFINGFPHLYLWHDGGWFNNETNVDFMYYRSRWPPVYPMSRERIM